MPIKYNRAGIKIFVKTKKGKMNQKTLLEKED